MRGLEPAQLGFKAKPATPEADRLTEDESHDAVLISERTRLRQTGRCPLRSICFCDRDRFRSALTLVTCDARDHSLTTSIYHKDISDSACPAQS